LLAIVRRARAKAAQKLNSNGFSADRSQLKIQPPRTLIDDHGTKRRAITPNHFVFGVCVHTPQKEFVWRVKI
jgi:hypothetical protein